MGLFEGLSRAANNVIEKGKEIVSPANKKFNEIFKGIFGKNSATRPEGRSLALKKEGRISGSLIAFHNPNIGFKCMQIEWGGKKPSMYRLDYESGNFTLSTTEGENGKKIKNLTEEELLNNVLPKFEKRLNEAKNLQRQERQKSINNAGKYAYEKDQNDADKLLEGLENPDNSNLA